MQVNKISFTGGGYFNTYSKNETEYYKRPPKTNSKETTEYFYNVDRKMRSIPTGWDYIFAMDNKKRQNFADLISLTFKTTDEFNSYSPRQNEKTAQYAMKDIQELISCGGILSDDEKHTLKDKIMGSFEIEELDKIHSRLPEKKESAKDNLSFLKVLMQDENKPYFDKMSPKTATSILSEEYLDFDYYMGALSNLKEDRVLEYPEDEIRETIHIYLTGKTLNYDDSVETYDRNISF